MGRVAACNGMARSLPPSQAGLPPAADCRREQLSMSTGRMQLVVFVNARADRMDKSQHTFLDRPRLKRSRRPAEKMKSTKMTLV
jgi:hypothetical protein